MAYIDKLISSNEQILLKQRRHWAALLSIAWNLLSSLISLAILYFVYQAVVRNAGPFAGFGPLVRIGADLRPALRFLPFWVPVLVPTLMILSLVWQFIGALLRWMNALNIVTTRRVIQVQGVLSKSSIDSSLEKVNDVLLEQSFMGRILGYGHLKIMTASETGLNNMHYLPDPLGFKRVLLTQNSVSATPPQRWLRRPLLRHRASRLLPSGCRSCSSSKLRV